LVCRVAQVFIAPAKKPWGPEFKPHKRN
jgi:hypothetical protein